MKRFFYLLLHELKMLFVAPATYVASVLFLSIMGIIYLSLLSEYSRAPQYTLPAVAFYGLFWLPVFFVVPLLTMKSFAEEHRLGTLETLMTTPVSVMGIVCAKFISAYVLYMGLWFLTLIYPLIVSWSLPTGLAQTGLFDPIGLFGGLIFIALSGVFYIALGLFASSLTRSQLVAGMLTFGMLFITILGSRLWIEFSLIDFSWVSADYFLSHYAHVFDQLEDFSRGIIDTRVLFLYLTGGCFFLGVTGYVVEAKV